MTSPVPASGLQLFGANKRRGALLALCVTIYAARRSLRVSAGVCWALVVRTRVVLGWFKCSLSPIVKLGSLSLRTGEEQSAFATLGVRCGLAAADFRAVCQVCNWPLCSPWAGNSFKLPWRREKFIKNRSVREGARVRAMGRELRAG